MAAPHWNLTNGADGFFLSTDFESGFTCERSLLTVWEMSPFSLSVSSRNSLTEMLDGIGPLYSAGISPSFCEFCCHLAPLVMLKVAGLNGNLSSHTVFSGPSPPGSRKVSVAMARDAWAVSAMSGLPGD